MTKLKWINVGKRKKTVGSSVTQTNVRVSFFYLFLLPFSALMALKNGITNCGRK
jgi:hypothetical protein